ncbi:MAG: hypothetical protein ACE5H9_06995 [Anaerolineae bacterium]
MNLPNDEIPPIEGPDTPPDTLQPTAPPDQTQPGSSTDLGIRMAIVILLAVYAAGLASGYLIWGRVLDSPANLPPEAGVSSETASEATPEPAAPANAVNLPPEYTLPVSFGSLGPQLLEARAIDYNRFVETYRQAGQPLTEGQLAVLTEGSDRPIVFNRENAYFLLNFFWALGLTNQNSLLEEGPLRQYSQGDIGRFASTGGWTLGASPATALYASEPLIPLTPEQQARLEEVAYAVYRPCCNNPTAFPDCNHGMAMLGLLELLASQGASTDEMFTAAKYVNAFWFPQQTFELAAYFKAAKGLDLAEMDARQVVGVSFSSGSGFQAVHQWLGANGLLEPAPAGGGGCGV